MIDGEMKEQNLRFCSFISPSIMYNRIYLCSEELRMCQFHTKHVKHVLSCSGTMVNDLPQFFRGERRIDVRDPKSIGNRIGDRRNGADGSSFTDTFHTKRVEGSQGHGEVSF